MLYYSPENEDEVAIRALQSIKLFRDHYASSTPSTKHIQDIIQMLEHHGARNKLGPYGGLLTNIADAISKTYFGKFTDESRKKIIEAIEARQKNSSKKEYNCQEVQEMVSDILKGNL